jgi:hypothetical protein
MSIASKHILTEIADKLDKKQNDWELKKRQIESFSPETLEILGKIIDLYEKKITQESLTEEEQVEYNKLFGELQERDDIKELSKK